MHLAYWHYPLTSAAKEADMWQDFYNAGSTSSSPATSTTTRPRSSERPTGRRDPNGPREVVVGTGGDDAHGSGLLKMTLHANSADWRFVARAPPTRQRDLPRRLDAAAPAATPAPKPPVTDFEATQDPSGLTVAFEDISTAIPQVTSWKWSFGDGATSAQQSEPTPTPRPAPTRSR